MANANAAAGIWELGLRNNTFVRASARPVSVPNLVSRSSIYLLTPETPLKCLQHEDRNNVGWHHCANTRPRTFPVPSVIYVLCRPIIPSHLVSVRRLFIRQLFTCMSGSTSAEARWRKLSGPCRYAYRNRSIISLETALRCLALTASMARSL